MLNNIIFLYAELTGYFLGCIKELENSSRFNIYIIYLNGHPNEIEKYNFNSTKFFLKESFLNKYKLLSFCKEKKPSKLFISGVMHKDYLYVSRKLKTRTIRVCLFDTILTNESSLKLFIKKFFYKIYFDKMWGTGQLHFDYASKLGYKNQNIFKYFYVAEKIFFENKIKVSKTGSLNILFIGRLVKEKNFLQLVCVVNSLIDKGYNINLNIIGDGELKNKIPIKKGIVYHGFLDKKQIIKIAKKSNLFCLPSVYEPWGVVTHEMTLLGFPLLISNKCGSAKDLLIEGENGLSFNPHNKEDLKEKIKKFYFYDNEKLSSLSASSKLISRQINHKLWINTFNLIS